MIISDTYSYSLTSSARAQNRKLLYTQDRDKYRKVGDKRRIISFAVAVKSILREILDLNALFILCHRFVPKKCTVIELYRACDDV